MLAGALMLNFNVGRLMARPEGFEPPTTWFEARYSIQLSYGRKRDHHMGLLNLCQVLCYSKQSKRSIIYITYEDTNPERDMA